MNSIGRPFLVEHCERRAPLQARPDWSAARPEVFTQIHAPLQRQRLARYYEQVGLMEHAAIAAFARLALQLLGLGAPSELIELAVQAQQDELEHARLAFGLASQLSGVCTGPGPIRIEGALDESSLHDIAYTTVIEGCVGETIAALEAAELRDCAGDATLKSIFTRFAEDEARHARLAWRVIAWLLTLDQEGVQSVVKRAFRDATHLTQTPRHMSTDDILYGALNDARSAELRLQTLQQVVAPAAATLGIELSELWSE